MANIFKDDKKPELTEEQRKFADLRDIADHATKSLSSVNSELILVQQHLNEAKEYYFKALRAVIDLRAISDNHTKP